MSKKKISFGTSKSKFRKFDDKPSETSAEIKIDNTTTALAVVDKKAETPVKKSISEILNDLKEQLINRYNVDDISVYLITSNKEYKLEYKKIYGLDISRQVLEKYYGIDCPIVHTNAEGLSDNSSHRARLVEKYGDYLIIVSSGAYECFKFKNELDEIRNTIKEVVIQ